MYKYKKVIPFFDVDPMKVVWHGNYVKYFEEARCSFLSQIGLTYLDMEKLGYAFPVVEMKIKYIRPCVFGQEIDIYTELVQCSNFLIFKYVIKDAKNGKKLCKAETKQMCINISTKETLFSIPKEILDKLGIVQ